MKKIVTCLLAAIIVLSFASVCFAAGNAAVVDRADLFTDEQEADLTEQIREMVGTYGYDFVLLTDTTSGGRAQGQYAADFYKENGYGTGQNRSGSIWFICMEPGNRGWYTLGTGDCEYLYKSSKNINGIDDIIEDKMIDGDYYGAASDYIAVVSEMYRTGEVKEPKNPFFNVGIALILGVLAGLIAMGVLSAGMKSVKAATQANDYLVKGSFKLRNSRDYFLYTHVTRIRRQTSNSGHSSTGSFHSGGQSFSGGGRKF